MLKPGNRSAQLASLMRHPSELLTTAYGRYEVGDVLAHGGTANDPPAFV